MNSSTSLFPKLHLGACLALALTLVGATCGHAAQPFKVLFDFSRLTGDRDHNFGERHFTNTFDVNGSAGTTLSVINAGYLMAQNKTNVWIVLNDTDPNTLNAGPSANVDDLQAGTNVIVRTRLEYLYAGNNTVTNESMSAGILFGLTGTGAARSGYLARVERPNTPTAGTSNSTLYIDAFVNGQRGANVAVSTNFAYGANNSLHFLELRISSDGTQTNASFKIFADSVSPGTGSNTVRLVDAAFDSAAPQCGLTASLPNYSEGHLGLWAEDDSWYGPTNPVAAIVRYSNFYAKSGVLPPTVSIVATDAEGDENGDSGTIVVSRAFPDIVSTNVSLTVYYGISGTASNGADFPALSGEVTIPVGATSVSLTVTPTDDGESELTETLTLTLLATNDYVLEAPTSATMTIFDNDPTQIGVYASDPSAYERVTNLTAAFTLVRYGATNSAVTANVSYTGTAAAGVDYLAGTNASFAAGDIYQTILVSPVDNTNYAGDKTVILTVDAGTGYTPAPDNSATATIVDDELPTETVLWSENFDSADAVTNFSLTAGARIAPNDYTTNWFYDYLASGIPTAPHGTTNYGLQLSANKGEPNAYAAAVNLYPVGQSFSNNFALRFNLFINYGQLNSELALFGINQSGNSTNWTVGSFGRVRYGEGVWVGLNTVSDFGSATIFAVTNVGSAPVPVAGANGTSLANILNNPPFTIAGGGGNTNDSTTKTWLDCELNQVGSVITLKVNNTAILVFTNTTATTSGNIMLGYNDDFDSIGSADGYAIFDNVRVVSLPPTSTPVITSIGVSGATVTINFNAQSDDVPANFKLQSTATVTGTFVDDNAALITGSAGSYQATTTVSGDTQFYRVRRQ